MKLSGRAVIVTGGAKGIGRATSLLLATEGARVAIFDIHEDEAAKTITEIEHDSGYALFIRTDITKEEEVRSAVDEVVASFGGIDVLVNNAGWSKLGELVDVEKEVRDMILNVNLMGTLYATAAVIPHMIHQNSGRIINISSGAGRIGSAGNTIYSTAKAGVIGFTKALAREVARNQINVNCICPGQIDTDLLWELTASTPGLVEATKKNTPLRRLGKPEDIAAGVLYLASNDADFVTGQTLGIDGGLTMV
ncbi:SDR family NAD(P)-dependent oxidoreductase [Chloroflexota bacterium]